MVIVTSANWSTDVATLQTFEKDAGVWRAVFPAMAANIGRDGFSADKHEGDLRTPAGKYGFGTMFGQQANPGVKFPYRVADAKSVWVDDRVVAVLQHLARRRSTERGGRPRQQQSYGTAYAYAVDIAYNTNPVVPARGVRSSCTSATGGGTAGCVSIAQANLLEGAALARPRARADHRDGPDLSDPPVLTKTPKDRAVGQAIGRYLSTEAIVFVSAFAAMLRTTKPPFGTEPSHGVGAFRSVHTRCSSGGITLPWLQTVVGVASSASRATSLSAAASGAPA